MLKDDLGVEYDETVGEALKDPKSTVLRGVFDYFQRRSVREAEIAQEEKDKEEKKNAPKGFFDGILS